LTKLVEASAGELQIANKADFFPSPQGFHIIYKPSSISAKEACASVDKPVGTAKPTIKVEGEVGVPPQAIIPSLKPILVTSVTVDDIKPVDISREDKQSILRHYGYIIASMVRTRILHDYLLSLAANQGFADEGRSYSIPDLLESMPVTVFLQVIGCSSYNKYLEEYLQSTLVTESMRLKDLPKDVRDHLARGAATASSIEYTLRRGLAVLVKLELLLVETRVLGYKVHRSISLKAFSDDVADEDLVGTYDFSSGDDSFWQDLQLQASLWPKDISMRVPANYPLIPAEVFNSSNWLTPVILSASQRKALDEFSFSISTV
jgi:hypothetical protein